MDVGDKVRVDGKVAKIVSKYNAGKHTNFCLDDGRAVLDLHLRSDVAVVADRLNTAKPLVVPKEEYEKRIKTMPLRVDEEVPPHVVNGEDWKD